MIIHDAGEKSGGHARLAPSSAARWLSCGASITLVEEHRLAEREGGPAARAGTILHHVLERALRGGLALITPEEVFELEDVGEMPAGRAFKILDTAIATARELLRLHRITELWLEHRVTPAIGRNDCWGTADVIGYSKPLRRLLVLDLKSGRHRVEAQFNDQGLLYSLAAHDELTSKGRPIDDIRFVILQPGLGHPADSWTIEPTLLEAFRAFLIERAARTDRPATPNPGGWCEWCQARNVCPAISVTPPVMV